MPTQPPLRILIDTNVFIAAESDEMPRHAKAVAAAELLSLAARLGHAVCVASTIKDDFSRHADASHRLRRSWQLERYHQLEPIEVPAGFAKRAGYPPSVGPSGRVDMTLLLALERSAAQWLVTDDQGLLSHAADLDLADRAFSLADALDVLRRQVEQPVDVPSVQEIRGYRLDVTDPIFDDFDPSYDIKTWIKDKVAPQHRPCLTIGDPGHLDSLVILNHETENSWGLPGPVLKICTFKVAAAARGVKRGELLLWAIFQHARNNNYGSVFVEVFKHEASVIGLFESFGFGDLGVATSRPGELVLGKQLEPDPAADLSPLEHHIRYGPGALRPQRHFLVPIVPVWHASLFPVADDNILMPGQTDYGNAIRKAYLCNSPMRCLTSGDTLLFFRTRQRQEVRAVGVVESTLVSSDPVAILEYTGRRTVYSPDEVGQLCQKPVLAVRFRLDRVLDTPITAAELVGQRVMRRSPQSLMQVKNAEAAAWLNGRLVA